MPPLLPLLPHLPLVDGTAAAADSDSDLESDACRCSTSSSCRQRQRRRQKQKEENMLWSCTVSVRTCTVNYMDRPIINLLFLVPTQNPTILLSSLLPLGIPYSLLIDKRFVLVQFGLLWFVVCL